MTEKEAPPTIEELEAKGQAPWKGPGPDDKISAWTFNDLYVELCDFFRDHLDLRDPRYYHVLTAWTLHTWRIHDWRASGPLLLVGAVSSGKTTVLECLEEVAYRGVRGGSMSNATMFRLSHEFTPTLLVDESQIYNKEEYAETQAFLNERYRKGGKVWRMVGEGTGMIPKFFNAYGGTALAQSDMPSNEGMVSRALILKMEKGRPLAQTLTLEFERQGAELRAKLKAFSERFVNLQHERDDPGDDWNPFVGLGLEKIRDFRIKEVGYPLLIMSPNTGPRSEILSYLMDLEIAHQAQESTGDTADFVLALSQCEPDGGKVSFAAIRVQWAIGHGLYDPVKGVITNEKAIPYPKTVSSQMQTLGFTPCRLTGGLHGIQFNADLMKRLCDRYGIKWTPTTLESPSLPSLPSLLTVKQSDASDASDANPEGGLYPQKRDSLGGPLSCEYCAEEWQSNEGYRKHVCPVGPKSEQIAKWT